MGDHKHRQLNKWRVLGLFWLGQAAVAFVVSVFWVTQGGSVEMATPLGILAPSEYLEVATDLEFLSYFTLWISVFTFLQALFLYPVRKPCARAKRGTSVWVSLSIAGLLIVAMSFAIYWASLAAIMHFFGEEAIAEWAVYPAVVLSVMAVSWVLFSALLIRFCRATPRETLLSRLASRLFLGTIIEVAAIIPLDIMIRRKTDCYCLAGTYFALSICGTIGLFIAGPAVFLAILSKRRKRWYQGRCEVCGYDMSGCPDVDRCPECGSGWRAPKEIES